MRGGEWIWVEASRFLCKKCFIRIVAFEDFIKVL